MAHPASSLAPREPARIRLGEKRFDVKFGFLSKVIIEERHNGSDDLFIEDLKAAISGERAYWRVVGTLVLAGCAHHHLTEEELDALVGEDTASLEEAARICRDEWLRANGFVRPSEDDAPGEAKAALPEAEG